MGDVKPYHFVRNATTYARTVATTSKGALVKAKAVLKAISRKLGLNQHELSDLLKGIKASATNTKGHMVYDLE